LFFDELVISYILYWN